MWTLELPRLGFLFAQENHVTGANAVFGHFPKGLTNSGMSRFWFLKCSRAMGTKFELAENIFEAFRIFVRASDQFYDSATISAQFVL
jgi:hypothetical protein